MAMSFRPRSVAVRAKRPNPSCPRASLGEKLRPRFERGKKARPKPRPPIKREHEVRHEERTARDFSVGALV